MEIEPLHKRFTQTARWLSLSEIETLIKYYRNLDHKDSKGCITYLERMSKENFCIMEIETMNEYIIDVTNEAGVVILQTEDKVLLDQDEITVGRTQWIVSSVEQEYDDYYNLTRYKIYVY